VQDVPSWSVIFQARLSSWQCAAAITRVALQAWLRPLLRRSGAFSGALAERGGATRWGVARSVSCIDTLRQATWPDD
jgi:hypothetical protein